VKCGWRSAARLLTRSEFKIESKLTLLYPHGQPCQRRGSGQCLVSHRLPTPPPTFPITQLLITLPRRTCEVECCCFFSLSSASRPQWHRWVRPFTRLAWGWGATPSLQPYSYSRRDLSRASPARKLSPPTTPRDSFLDCTPSASAHTSSLTHPPKPTPRCPCCCLTCSGRFFCGKRVFQRCQRGCSSATGGAGGEGVRGGGGGDIAGHACPFTSPV
jgi:hypothetical protein